MSTGYQIKDQKAIYFLTFQVVDWIDIFTRQRYRDIIIDSFKFAIEHKGFRLFAYVIMSNHVHLIASSANAELSNSIRDIKKYTSKRIIKSIFEQPESRREWLLNRFESRAKQNSRNQNYQVWTHENHAIFLYSSGFSAIKLHYIHMNPVKAGWVVRPEDYVYSSARNYADLDYILEVEIMNLSGVYI